jgi:predicted acyl esterase
VAGLCALIGTAVAPAAHAEVPASLEASCTEQTPHPGYSYRFCDDGVPPVAGTTPNVGGVSAIRVPAKYDGFEGLPPKAGDAGSVPGADAEGMVALDVDVSVPDGPVPPGGRPLIAFMHGCCSGTKTSWEATSFDGGGGEQWHYNNAWYAARGYVVVTYTARGFRGPTGGSTGQTQLDSRRYEINDFQHLVGQIADDPFFGVDPQRIVPTGGSYGGGFAWLALTDPVWQSPGGKSMKLAVSAPRYGWTDLLYSLVPNGMHFQSPDRLPAFDGSDSTDPFGFPKETINRVLFLTGLLGGTAFPPSINQAFTCLTSRDPFETSPFCTTTLSTTVPEFIEDRSAYYQNQFFDRIATDPSYRIPVFNAGTFTDPLFTAVENLRMSNRLERVVPGYPIQQYFGDYEHFAQNKAKEWGDLCRADRHVCAFSDYPGGNVHATPIDLRRTGVTTRLNRFVDHYAKPSRNSSEPPPRFDVTASLEICRQNASPAFPLDEPGPTFTAGSFAELAPYTFRIDYTGTRTTRNPASENAHANLADPLDNLLSNGGGCPDLASPPGPDEAAYDSEPLARPLTMIGGARIAIDYSASTADGLQLNTRLVDVFPDGQAVMVDRGVRRVTSASGTVEYQLHGNGWRFEPGHRVRVEIAQDEAPFIKASVISSSATLTGARLRIPVREPQRADFRNSNQFCKAELEFLGDEQFADRYGTNRNARNAFGKCVSRS